MCLEVKGYLVEDVVARRLSSHLDQISETLSGLLQPADPLSITLHTRQTLWISWSEVEHHL